MPEFSATDVNGKPFTYTQSGGKVLMLAFLSTQQERSQQALKDIVAILSDIEPKYWSSLQMALIVQDVQDESFVASVQQAGLESIQILVDENYSLWGKLGIVAKPTVVISNPQGKVVCVKPGYVYDFAPVVKSGLYQALGIPTGLNQDSASSVATLTNSTASAKARRHLSMAKLLREQNRIASALVQAKAAHEIDPNAIDATLLLGELLCLTGQAQEALQLVDSEAGQTQQQKAKANLILGWALRQRGELQTALGFLQAGRLLDPNSPRLLFELGQVHQGQNNTVQAMQAYAQALQLIFEDARE